MLLGKEIELKKYKLFPRKVKPGVGLGAEQGCKLLGVRHPGKRSDGEANVG